MERNRNIAIILISGLFGVLTASILSTTLYRADLDSWSKWGITLSLLTLGFGVLFFWVFSWVWQKFIEGPAIVRVWGTLVAMVAAVFFSLHLNILFLLPLILATVFLTSFTFGSFQRIYDRSHTLSFLTAWALSGLISFFVMGFLRNFYTSSLVFLICTFMINAVLTVIVESILIQIKPSWNSNRTEWIIPIAVLLLGVLLIVWTLALLLKYPGFFTPDFFLIPVRLLPLFFGGIFLAQGWSAWLIQILNTEAWQSSPLLQWMGRNLPGLLLACTFSISTYLLATALVSYNVAFLDMFFQTDSPFWLNFLTSDADQLILMRAVHPFVYLILRPPVWLISLFLHGNKYHAALLLNTFFGGVCVFLAWLFFKKRTGNTAYSMLFAALLGLSTAHLVLSALLESYIFSGAALILFILLLQKEDSKFWQLVLAGLVTFGITLTNFIQTSIGFLLVREDRKNIVKYGLVVMALAVLLSLVQTTLYPHSDPFYVTSRFKTETYNIDSYSDLGPDKVRQILISRMNVTFRNINLFSMVAPRPIIRYDEPNCKPLCFRVMQYFRGQYKYASYIGFGSLLARTWFLALILAGAVFAWRFFKSPAQSMLQLALLSNIIFNFVLHIKYGDDPLLYTPDWTYALVFFVGISFERLADRKWLQILLFLFLGGLLVNNLNLFKTLFETMLPFYP